MKRIFVFSLLSCILLAACTQTKKNTTRIAPFPREPEAALDTEIAPIPTETAPGTALEPAPTPAPTPAMTPPAKRESVYGIPEPGKLGYMRSPYHPEAGLIEYRGLPPGTAVKDPYTPGKILLVP